MSRRCGQISSWEALSTHTHPFCFLDFSPTFLKNSQRPLKRGDSTGSRDELRPSWCFVKLITKATEASGQVIDTHQILVATDQTMRKAPGRSPAHEHSKRRNRSRRAFSLSSQRKIDCTCFAGPAGPKARQQLGFLPRPHSGLSHLHGAPGDGSGPLVQTGQGQLSSRMNFTQTQEFSHGATPKGPWQGPDHAPDPGKKLAPTAVGGLLRGVRC